MSCGAAYAWPIATSDGKLGDRAWLEHSVTTCAYCGVGCSFKAEMKGDQLIRMVPYKGGDANHGHSR